MLATNKKIIIKKNIDELNQLSSKSNLSNCNGCLNRF